MARYKVDSGELSIAPWWSLPQFAPSPEAGDVHELAARFEALLEDSVRKQLVADVPVAILLSGGVDSSLVTAMAARARPRVKTFTVTFPGHGTFDEAPYARLVAEHFGTDHTELAAHEVGPEILARLARQFDEPIADSSMIPTFLISSLVREHATVALGGDGGDELFAGYPHYTWIPRFELVRKAIPSPLARTIGHAAERRLRVGTRGRSYLAALAKNELRDALGAVNVYFDRGARAELLKCRPLAGAVTPEELRVIAGGDGGTLLQAAQRMDVRTYMADDILVKVDRASMLASLETRAPFLDYRMIEFAFGAVPDSLKATLRQRKVLPRRVAARILPKTLDLRRKQGFSIPLHTWFAGHWGPPMREVLSEADPDIFNRETIARLIADQERGFANAHRLFAIVLFELWRREYGICGIGNGG
jgi:asparagine synthase (glutamine-hydrolysing)